MYRLVARGSMFEMLRGGMKAPRSRRPSHNVASSMSRLVIGGMKSILFWMRAIILASEECVNRRLQLRSAVKEAEFQDKDVAEQDTFKFFYQRFSCSGSSACIRTTWLATRDFSGCQMVLYKGEMGVKRTGSNDIVNNKHSLTLLNRV